MQMIYNEEEDLLVILNPTNEPGITRGKYRGNVFIDYDIEGIPVSLEIGDASIVLGISKKTLKKFTEIKLIENII